MQAIKAGLLECADVFAVNKADREGADSTVRDLELMIALGGEVARSGAHSRGHTAATLDGSKQVVRHDAGKWIPPIVKTIATRKDAVETLFEKLELHRAWLFDSEPGAVRRAARVADGFRNELRDALLDAASESLGAEIDAAATRVAARELDPYTAAERLVDVFRAR